MTELPPREPPLPMLKFGFHQWVNAGVWFIFTAIYAYVIPSTTPVGVVPQIMGLILFVCWVGLGTRDVVWKRKANAERAKLNVDTARLYAELEELLRAEEGK